MHVSRAFIPHPCALTLTLARTLTLRRFLRGTQRNSEDLGGTLTLKPMIGIQVAQRAGTSQGAWGAGGDDVMAKNRIPADSAGSPRLYYSSHQNRNNAFEQQDVLSSFNIFDPYTLKVTSDYMSLTAPLSKTESAYVSGSNGGKTVVKLRAVKRFFINLRYNGAVCDFR